MSPKVDLIHSRRALAEVLIKKDLTSANKQMFSPLASLD